MKIQFVFTSSQEYKEACDLRYRAFFRAHELPFDILFDEKEETSFHLVALDVQNQVIGYARLSLQNKNTYQISQVAVKENCQQKGIGAKLMEVILEKAKSLKARKIDLEARISATSFYKKFGFQITGEEFESKKTGVPHVRMEKLL